MPPRLEKGAATERVEIKASVSWLARLDEWRSARRPIPSRSEAIRMLVDQALDTGRSSEKPAEPGAA